MPGIVQLDPYLEPFEETLKRRYSKAQQWIDSINKHEGGFDKFSKVCPDRPDLSRTAKSKLKGYEKYGFVVQSNGDIVYREWAPNAMRAYLIGDFSTTIQC